MIARNTWPQDGHLPGGRGALGLRATFRGLKGAFLLVCLVSAFVAFVLPRSAGAWWYGRGYSPAPPTDYPWRPGPWVLFPSQRPRPEYRYSIPTGIPLSFDDPASGMTYCLSQTTGFYFVCGLNPTGAVSAMPPLPMPIPLGTPPADSALPPASGVLMFRLPQDAQVSVNGVPVGLSDGVGIQAVRPGPHQIILNVAGKETTHRVNVASHAIFTITIAGVVATEP